MGIYSDVIQAIVHECDETMEAMKYRLTLTLRNDIDRLQTSKEVHGFIKVVARINWSEGRSPGIQIEHSVRTATCNG